MISSVSNDLSSTLAANAVQASAAKPPDSQDTAKDAELRKAFDAFVGEAFFSQMLQSMRKTVNKPAYFHGGKAEEIFQKQLDQVLAEKVSKSVRR